MKKTRKIRPTSSLVRNAIFNILGDIEDLYFLDLFAGTGQIGLEAERRGARVVFVERDPKLAMEIRKKTRGKVIKGDAMKVLKKLDFKPHIVFADPPYAFERYAELIKAVLEVLEPEGVFILEHDKRKKFGAQEERVYGDTVLSIWRKEL